MWRKSGSDRICRSAGSKPAWRWPRSGSRSSGCRREQRAVLMLVTVEGLSYKEAAAVTGVPVGTIMSRLARARIALHQQLEAGAGVRRSATNAQTQ